MRIVLLANHWVGLKVCEYLKAKKETISLLGVHEPDKQNLTREIIAAAGIDHRNVFTADKLRDPQFVEAIRRVKPDIIISAFWAYILKPDVLRIPTMGTINMHPAYLPYNRGVHPNVWSFVEGTPAGVTLHYIDEGIDTGDIIAREHIPIHALDTAETLYYKTLVEIVALFARQWPLIRSGKVKRISQQSIQETPSMHKRIDIKTLDEIDLDATYTGRELMNRLRARSYSNQQYAYYKDGETYVSVRLSIAGRNNPEMADEHTKRKKISGTQAKKQLVNIFTQVKNDVSSIVPREVLYQLPSGKYLEMYCISSTVAQLPNTMQLLTSWRALNQRWFPSEFPVTAARTKKWFYERVLLSPDRILFFLRIAGSRAPFGHIGLYRYDADTQSIELDNVMRGVKGSASVGCMTVAMGLLEKWIREYLPVAEISLRVFSDNHKAIALYMRCGFRETSRVPLVKIKKRGVVEWQETKQMNNKATRYYVRMKKTLN
jgi:methionyl-tRNA formyltransferase/RimJ/RimL family protein N-acetyltransferase